ncbi:diacylglycerol kinase family protein [Legionella sp.]|uniref:diacylglycerol/lipid kinase family protein n=1 Tax=Legionella sp. TaxID=459 RepID=UPI000CB14615|nr:diacylglycerol kinase family protein [Legionella sp.]PJE10757.1 MAG: diacylglycerol kinase [Legionella sp.]
MNTIAVVINNKAKNHAEYKPYLDAFEETKIPYKLYVISPKKLALTLQKCISKHKLIFVGGGDGTIRTAAQYCINTSTILGVLPLGTLNHLAKELGLPLNAKDLIESLQKNQTVTIDVGTVNGFIFLNNASVGFYPKFANKRDLYTRTYNKWLSYIPSFIHSLKKHRIISLTIKSKHLNLSLRTSFLMVSNNLYSYEFPMTLKRKSFHASLLGLYFLKHGKIRLLKIIKHLFTSDSQFEIHQSKLPIEVYFNNNKEITISLDGDTQKVKGPLLFKTLPHSLTLLSISS